MKFNLTIKTEKIEKFKIKMEKTEFGNKTDFIGALNNYNFLFVIIQIDVS